MSQPAEESQQMIVENMQSGIDSASTEQPALKRKAVSGGTMIHRHKRNHIHVLKFIQKTIPMPG